MKIQKSRITKKRLFIILTVSVLLIAAIIITSFIIINNNRQQNNTKAENTSQSKATTSSSTTIDKTNDSSTVNQGSNVEIVVVDASKYGDIFEVRAYASDVVEDGTCSYAFTNGTDTVTKTSVAKAGASTSSCSTIDIPVSELSASNTWNLTVKYTSNSENYNGETNKKITIE